MENLTQREEQILELVAAGMTNAEIGWTLYLGEETVKSHVRHILCKLNAKSRAHAVHLGWVAGLLDIGSFRETADVLRHG